MKIPYITIEYAKAAVGTSLAEEWLQSLNRVIDGINAQQESEYITAAQARELGAGKAAVKIGDAVYVYDRYLFAKPLKATVTCLSGANDGIEVVLGESNNHNFPVGCLFWVHEAQLRVIKQAQPEPVDPHAVLRAEYAKQVKDGTTGFYLWEYKLLISDGWEDLHKPSFFPEYEYHCTDISCYVSKDGEPAVRMLRTEARALQDKLGDTVEWKHPNMTIYADEYLGFSVTGTYTYRTKATIKLDGRIVTPEQAAAEWEAKKETHVMWFKFANIDWTDVIGYPEDYVEYFANTVNCEYELRPKKPTWTGSRDDVIALLKEEGLL